MKDVDVNGVRYRLMQYTSLLKDIERWNLKIEELHAKINGVASGSPKKLPEGHPKEEDWRSPLFEDIEKYQALIETNEKFIQLVHEFVSRLDQDGKQLIDKLFLRNQKRTYTDICHEYGYTRTGLQKKVAILIRDNWKY